MKWKQPKVAFAILVLLASAISVVCIDIWKIKAELDDLYWIADNTHSGMVRFAIEKAESSLHQRLMLLTVLTVSTILVLSLLIITVRIRDTVVATVLLALLLGLVASVASQPLDGGGGGGNVEYAKVMVPPDNPNIKVLIAYDEEVANGYFDWFGEDINGVTYVSWQTTRALWHFPSDVFSFSLRHIQWNSEDGKELVPSMLEMASELGWDRGMFYNDEWMSLLVGWTGEDNDPCGGKAYIGQCVCLSKIQEAYADDNTVQEEFSHLFGLDWHCYDDGCVMSRDYNFYGWTDESLMPIEDRTVTIQIWNNQYAGYLNNEWCFDHYVKLVASDGIPVRDRSDIASTPGINPRNPPPDKKEGLNPRRPWFPWLILGIGLTISAIVVFLYIYKKHSARKLSQGLTTVEARHRLALIEGQKRDRTEIKSRAEREQN